MIFKLLLFCLFFWIMLNAKECSPYYNPEKFYDVSDKLIELIDSNISNKKLPFFGSSREFKSLEFVKEKDYFISKDKHTKLNDYIYPSINGLWKYKVSDDYIDEINIAQIELYQYEDTQIAHELNEMYENYWSDWIENAYEMQLTPEQTLFRYNDTYFSFSVYIYGFKGDSTPLKGTIINYWFKDYTKHVNNYIKCMKEKNDS